jgi:hypothetical protein
MKTSTTERFGTACGCLILVLSAAQNVSACEASDDLIFNKAYALIQSGQLDEAQQQLESLSRPNPRPEVLNNLAAIAQQEDKWERALSLVAQALAQSPSYASINKNYRLISSSRYVTLQLIEKLPCKEDVRASMNITQAIDIANKSREARYQGELTALALALSELPLSQFESVDVESNVPQLANPVIHPESLNASKNEANQKIKTLELALKRWAKAWQEQSIKDYLDFYAHDFNFASTGAGSRVEWERTRRERLSKYKVIKLVLTSIHYEAMADNVIQVRFNQKWQGDSKVVLTPGKTMKWRHQQGQWQIIS